MTERHAVDLWRRRHGLTVGQVCRGARIARWQLSLLLRGGTLRVPAARRLCTWSWEVAPGAGLTLADLEPRPDLRELAARGAGLGCPCR
jgi:hypothetical protein